MRMVASRVPGSRQRPVIPLGLPGKAGFLGMAEGVTMHFATKSFQFMSDVLVRDGRKFFARQTTQFVPSIHGQRCTTVLNEVENHMPLLQRARTTLGGLGLVFALPCLVYGQTTNSTNYYAPLGGEYAPAGNLPGDQSKAALSLNVQGGFLVWQDNITDGDGLGISAERLDGTFSGTGEISGSINRERTIKRIHK